MDGAFESDSSENSSDSQELIQMNVIFQRTVSNYTYSFKDVLIECGKSSEQQAILWSSTV